MTTVIYNTNTHTALSFHTDGYLVNGKPGYLHPELVELTVQYSTIPEHDPVTEKVVTTWEALPPNYVQIHQIVQKTETEIIDYINDQAEAMVQLSKNNQLDYLIEDNYQANLEVIALLGDEEALEVKQDFPPFTVPKTYQTGDRFYYPVNDKLYRVIGTEHTSQADWLPNTAVSLYEAVYVIPPGDLCETSPAWNGANHLEYTVGYHVRHEDKVFKAINTTHTWIAPALTGDGSASWEWVKDC